MTIYKTECPFCGAKISVEDPNNHFFCSYCGGKLKLKLKNNPTLSPSSVADLKRAETEQILAMNQIKVNEENRIADKESQKSRKKTSIVVACIGSFLLIVCWFIAKASGDPDSPFYMLSMLGLLCLISIPIILDHKDDNDESRVFKDGKVEAPYCVDESNHMSYLDVADEFRSAGFINVNCKPLNDLTLGFIKEPDIVDSITINGHIATSGRYFPDDIVIIYYHSF